MDPLSTTSLFSAAGPYAVAAEFLVILVESALPIGFVLPGDTLLLTAGLACATGRLPLVWTLAAAAAGAVLGAQGGFLLGRLGTRATRMNAQNGHIRLAVSRFEQFAKRRGYGPALIAARFVPVARSVAGPLSGLTGVPLALFTAWQAVGGLFWTTGVTLAGYGVGRVDPGLERYVPLCLVLSAVSFPVVAGCAYLLARWRGRRPLPCRHPVAARVPEGEEAAGRRRTV